MKRQLESPAFVERVTPPLREPDRPGVNQDEEKAQSEG
jgi:hypothetical protein